MKKYLLLALLASGSAFAQPTPQPTFTVTLTWTPPTKNTDGSNLTDLSRYKVYWGTVSGVYPNSVQITAPASSNILTNQSLNCNTDYFFVVTAVNSVGSESAYSNVATKKTPVCSTIPGAPSTLTVNIVLNATP